ncbi:fucose permease [Streptosporangium becharense]|uniref:Fucose permease n=1 Tax=Streptosporangium becharense TaxID=1816182 RepID=A0A7W9IJ06_9ACTN|nr:MFS transporter [Streptosporangium becharense]MBB2911313.1 fucose permease [Streptosporangium becharense]MBB5821629.1 fucose permease [Streptosporangium becharense]
MTTFDHTRRACYTGFVTQAIVNNLAPLLFIVFQTRYQVPVEMLGRLVLLNFATQLVTDIVAVRFVDRIGYRIPLVLAHVLSVLGLALLSAAPAILPSPYLGLCVAVVIYAVGGGLLEVLVSPVVDALPSPQEGKAAAMSLLHSFYCWGQVAVVAGSTLLLAWIGQDAWQVLPLVWAAVPLVNMVAFLRVPLPATVPDEHRTTLRALFTAPAFVAAVVLMLGAGAAELTMSQWSSLFAEEGLGVSKVWGDLAGPCLFAVLMGVGRFAYGMWGERIPLAPTMAACGTLATVCYLVVCLSANPVVSLVGCAVCGLAVSLLWPGTFSLAAARFPFGGAAMFGVLAVFGDAGGAIGPWVAGAVADAAATADGFLGGLPAALPGDGGSGLRTGLLVVTVFPLAVAAVALAYGIRSRRTTGLPAGETTAETR